jgi:hypothetical protein
LDRRRSRCSVPGFVTATSPTRGIDLDGRDAAHTERVSHQRTAVPPRHCFGAHDRNAFFAAHADERGKRVAKFRGLHVIGNAAKLSFRQPVFGDFLRACRRPPSAPMCLYSRCLASRLSAKGAVEGELVDFGRPREAVLFADELQSRGAHLFLGCRWLEIMEHLDVFGTWRPPRSRGTWAYGCSDRQAGRLPRRPRPERTNHYSSRILLRQIGAMIIRLQPNRCRVLLRRTILAATAVGIPLLWVFAPYGRTVDFIGSDKTQDFRLDDARIGGRSAVLGPGDRHRGRLIGDSLSRALDAALSSLAC